MMILQNKTSQRQSKAVKIGLGVGLTTALLVMAALSGPIMPQSTLSPPAPETAVTATANFPPP